MRRLVQASPPVVAQSPGHESDLEKPMPIMSISERQLTKHLIGEREERVKSVKELWLKMDELQREIRVGRPNGTASSSFGGSESGASRGRADLAVPLDAGMPGASDAVSMREDMARLKDEMASWNNRIVELRTTIQRAEVNGQHGVEAALEKMSSWVNGVNHNARGDSGARHSDVEDMAHRILQLEGKSQHQEKELRYVRTVLVEVHKTLPLHEIRTSRLALRAVDISEEERQSALAALDAKEQKFELSIRRPSDASLPVNHEY